MNCNKKRPARQPLLVLSYADGHLEIFGEKNIDVHIARVPVATSAKAEIQAEEVAELLLPARYRELYRADLLRKNGATRPLLPSVLAAARQAREDIVLLDRMGVDTPAQEGVIWTL